ncbi:MAG: hypothetical protein HOV96_19610 [Nonomuraea sp.]|nr:hypothetical protein [Nonomuraea sp.]
MTVLGWVAAIATGLTSAGLIVRYLVRFGRWAAKVGRGVVELATLPAAVAELAGAMRSLGETTQTRLDDHERELARLATFHPRPEVLTL